MKERETIFKYLEYMKKHLITFMIMIMVIAFFQLFWSFSITNDFYSFSSMGMFLAVVKLPWVVKLQSIHRDAILQAHECDGIIDKCTSRIGKLKWNEINRPEFEHLRKRITKENKIKSKHLRLFEKTAVEYNTKSYIVQTLFFEALGIIIWIVINWLN